MPEEDNSLEGPAGSSYESSLETAAPVVQQTAPGTVTPTPVAVAPSPTPAAAPPTLTSPPSPVASPPVASPLETPQEASPTDLTTANPSGPTPVTGESKPPKRRRPSLFKFNKVAALATVTAGLVLVIAIVGGLMWGNAKKSSLAQSTAQVGQYDSDSLNLEQLKETGDLKLKVGSAQNVTINGQLKVSNSLVINPTATPTDPVTGQIYYDQTTNILYYYDGTKFVPIANGDAFSQFGPVSRTQAGLGLRIDGDTLINTGVLSVQGQTGDITFAAGKGIGINGLSFTNTGVTSLSGTPNQVQVSGSTGDITLSLPQDIATSSSPTFGGLTVNTIQAGVGTSTLNVGSTTHGLTLQGSATTLSQTTNGFTTTVDFTTPAANSTLRFPASTAGTYEICTTSNNCLGGSTGAPNGASYIVASLDPTLINERALAAGSNLTLTDGGANGNMTVATVQNPTFTTSVTTPLLQSTGALNITPGGALTVGTAGQTTAINGSAITITSIGINNDITLNSADTIELQDNTNIAGSLTVAGDLSANGNTTLGNASTDDLTINSQILGGSPLAFQGATDNGVTTTFAITQPTVNNTVTFRNASGTVCYESSTNCGFAASSGSGNYIQNGTTIQTSANFAIQSAAAGSIGGVIRGAASQTADLFRLQRSDGALLTSFNNNGALHLTTDNGQMDVLKLGRAASTYTTAMLSITSHATDSIPIAVRSASGQTANLFQLQNDSGTVLSFFDASGNLTVGSATNVRTISSPGSASNSEHFGASSTTNNATNSLAVGNSATVATGANSGTALGHNSSAAFLQTTAVGAGASATGTSLGRGLAVGANSSVTQDAAVAVGGSASATAAGGLALGDSANVSGDNSLALGRNTTVAHAGSIGIGFDADTTATNQLVIGSTNNTYAIQNVYIGSGVVNATPTSVTIQGTGGSGTDIAGANVTIAGGRGTGSANGGDIIFSTSEGGASGATLRSLSEKVRITAAGQLRVGVASTQTGSIQLANSGSANLGTLQVASLSQATTFTLPDPGVASVTLCHSQGNCAGAGTGITGSGTANFVAKFSAAQNVVNSQLFDNGTNAGINVSSGFGTVARLTVNSNSTADNAATTQINTGAAANKGLVIQGASSQSADLFQLQNSSGTILTAFQADGKLVFGPSGLQDTNLYRSAPDVLKTDDGLVVIGNLRAGTDTATAKLTVVGSTNSSAHFTNTATSGSGEGAAISLYSNDGAALASGDRLGALTLGGSYAAGDLLHNSAAITGFATEAWTATDAGGELRFETTPNDSTTRALRVTVPNNLDGFTFGSAGDTNLYRAQANVLATDDDFISFLNVTARTTSALQVSMGSVAGGFPGIVFGNGLDTTLFRSGAAELTTNGDLLVQGGDLLTNQTTFNLLNTTATTLNIGGAVGSGGINLAGGSGSTGCTIDGSNGNLVCSGSITGGSPVGFWARSGNTLEPTTAGDHVTTSGNISTSGSGTITAAGLLQGNAGLTVTGAAVNLNASSNFATNINTGTSTGTITLGGGSAPLVIDSTNFDVTSGGALSGITGYTQGSGSFSHTYGGTGDGHTLTANSLTTGAALKVTSSNNTAADTSWSGTVINATNAQGTTAVTGANFISGFDVQFTQAPTVAGNGETVANFAVTNNTGSPADSTVASILNLTNFDTATGNQITVTNGLRINGANVTNGINLSGTFGTNLITSTNFTVTQGGAITNSSTINGQTISSSANFTGTLAVAGTLSANGNVAIGDATTDRLTVTSQLQGASPLVFQGATDDGNEFTLAVADPSADVTYRFVNASGGAGTYDICTTDGNCAGVGTTLQQAYANGNTINTTDNRNIAFTLENTATDSNFLVNIAASSTGKFAVQNAGTDVMAITSAGQLALATQGITGGLLIGGDVNLYRSGADTLTSENLTLVGVLNANGGITTTSGNLSLNSTTGTIDLNSDNLTNVGNITGVGAVTLASSGAGNDIIINGADIFDVQDATTFASTATFNGVATFNTDVDLTLAETENLRITNTVSGTNALDLLNVELDNNTSSGNQFVAKFVNNGGTGVTEAILTLNNSDTNTAVDKGIDIQSGTGTITIGVDASDSDIGTAIHIGANDLQTAATTLASTELDRLDGKDAAIVDTNDAVNTAITGTGALGSGSITSGFGSIDVGADAITTTGTVSGGTVNATASGGLQTSGTTRIESDGDLVNIGNVTTTGASTFATTGATGFIFKPGTDNTTAFQLQRSGGGKLLVSDTTNSRIYIGDPSGDTTGVTLVLDTKTDAGDPTAVDGAMYYNSNLKKMRCAETDNQTATVTWRNCSDPTSPSTYVAFDEDFMGGNASTGSIGQMGWLRTLTNSGLFSLPATTDSTRPGMALLETNNASASGASAIHAANAFDNVLVNGGTTVEFAMNVTTLSTSGERFTVRAGLGDSATGDFTDGIYIEYDEATDTDWRCGTAAAGARTETSTGNVAVTTGWHRFKIVVNAAGTQVDCYVDGTSVTASIITNIPNTTTHLVSPVFHIVKSVGTANRTLYADYYSLRLPLTSPR